MQVVIDSKAIFEDLNLSILRYVWAKGGGGGGGGGCWKNYSFLSKIHFNYARFWNLSTNLYVVSENTPLSTKALLILVMPSFFAKIVPLLKAMVWEVG